MSLENNLKEKENKIVEIKENEIIKNHIIVYSGDICGSNNKKDNYNDFTFWKSK